MIHRSSSRKLRGSLQAWSEREDGSSNFGIIQKVMSIKYKYKNNAMEMLIKGVLLAGEIREVSGKDGRSAGPEGLVRL